ncbi:protein phosphatase 1 regulatory subunit 15A-like isoform X3 [Sinocyclocheilus anshuiensis]|uniref:protein phosphatase 1 regulatory subunit 15A-like isoform X3 n=1 Tax=Sinocyclocheilus anshuiensis TaxID=1608454 RepID=UPI0007B9A37E|nr:PREDICTED: protein phosphatase 1 regulatory subunit 15A-like isoform X3 [Sinocyclocheilus anshuiensis]
MLLYQCGLHLFMQSKRSPELSSGSPGAHEDLPLSHYRRTSVMKIRVCLWPVIRRVLNFCASVTELFGSQICFFICVGKNMTGESKKSGVEALERPGGEIGDAASEMKDPEVIMELDDDESADEVRESSEIDWDEEEDENEARLSEWESDEETEDEEDCETEDEDSEWSDEDEEDDEGDSEASAESLELWESFLNSGDPYNPLSFCSSISSRTNTEQCSQIKTQPKPDTRPEECEPKPKEGGEKVCFSDKVTVRPLVAWSFASRAARDGSCWMQMARDRERFRRRAESIETLLKPCLTAEHRAGVWERLQRKTSS